MSESKAAVVTAYHKELEIEEVRIPDLGPGDMLGKVDAATLCGTDVHFWAGQNPNNAVPPYIPGHETAVLVKEINGERTDIFGEPLKVGDRVVVAYRFCGQCFYCTVAHQPTLCSNSTRYGRARSDVSPYLLGGLSEYHYYPAGAEVIRIPDEVSSPLAAAAACAFRTIMHGFERLGPLASREDVVIQGSGPLGLFATAVARDRGARRVFTIGAPASRLDVALAMGADEVLNIEEVPDPAARLAWVMERTSGRGPDAVIQCVGSQAIPEGLDMVRRGGRYISIGTTGGNISVPGALFTGKYLQIMGIVSGRAHHFYEALDFLATRKNDFPFDRFITGAYTLERATEALHAMEDFREVKPVVFPNGNS